MAQTLGLGTLLQFRVWCTDNEQASVNTYHYVCGATTGQVTDLDAALDFDSAIHTSMQAFLAGSARYVGVEAHVIKKPLPAGQIANGNSAVGNGVSLPRQVSGLIGWKTALAGRRYRGRTYIPFPSVLNDEGSGVPSLAYIAALDTFAVVLQAFTQVTAAGGATVQTVFSLRQGDGSSPIPITDHVASNKWATQRRRGSYGRPNVSPVP
jgi:hypothetical protein